MKTLGLTVNIRVYLSIFEEVGTFTKQLLDIGNDILIGEQDGLVCLPFAHMVSALKEIITRVFPNLRKQFTENNTFKTSASLALNNVAVHDLVIKLLEQFLLSDNRFVFYCVSHFTISALIIYWYFLPNPYWRLLGILCECTKALFG